MMLTLFTESQTTKLFLIMTDNPPLGRTRSRLAPIADGDSVFIAQEIANDCPDPVWFHVDVQERDKFLRSLLVSRGE